MVATKLASSRSASRVTLLKPASWKIDDIGAAGEAGKAVTPGLVGDGLELRRLQRGALERDRDAGERTTGFVGDAAFDAGREGRALRGGAGDADQHRENDACHQGERSGRLAEHTAS